MTNKWQFFISKRHRRIQAWWRFFFAGWGLLFTLILVASPFVFKNMAWSILDIVDIDSIRQNNLSVTNFKMNGTDRNGNPFSLFTRAAFQRFSEPDVLYFEAPNANIVRPKNGKPVQENISAQMGKFFKKTNKIILSDDVRVKSGDGTSARANEMEIEL
ncbi:MAG: LPS export ABC transporter periplasmic protein LptC [Rickettsiales bacterium]|jgi:LPS export ABC transporter protein LptC|nr:LPS export ABC transporter periplasmic protein LptC [Rickettsiales bacterium]